MLRACDQRLEKYCTTYYCSFSSSFVLLEWEGKVMYYSFSVYMYLLIEINGFTIIPGRALVCWPCSIYTVVAYVCVCVLCHYY